MNKEKVLKDLHYVTLKMMAKNPTKENIRKWLNLYEEGKK